MKPFVYYETIVFNQASFFTAVLLPNQNDSFPTVIFRTPYVSAFENALEEDILREYLAGHSTFLERGYAVVVQHCRGQGKSTGEFVPYIHEHEDSRMLRDWIRKQPFYNGELFLWGSSYTSSLHYAAAPYESDIRGAVFEVQDTERYRLWYRNGQMRKGHANWHFSLYKPKCGLKKEWTMDSFSQLPLKGLSEKALGERAEDFEQMLDASRPEHPFWNTRYGGCDTKNVTDAIPFPVLFTSGYFDFYIGGIFSMWNAMRPSSRERCAFLVSPYDHGDGYDPAHGLYFENGKRREQFGDSYSIDWFDNIRNGNPLPYQKGVITYYRMFDNRWGSDFNNVPTIDRYVTLGTEAQSFCYDPSSPSHFCDEGTLQKQANLQTDGITLYSDPFEEDLFIKGKIRASLTVSSDCSDTSFYISLAIAKPEGDYRLRHDITSLSYQLGSYEKNRRVTLDFSFDEIAFLLQKGERIRVDITSTDNNTYVCHTNNDGPYATQTDSRKAVNTVFLGSSHLVLPIEISKTEEFS